MDNQAKKTRESMEVRNIRIVHKTLTHNTPSTSKTLTINNQNVTQKTPTENFQQSVAPTLVGKWHQA